VTSLLQCRCLCLTMSDERAYLDAQGVEAKLKDALSAVLKERPENAVEAVAKKLMTTSIGINKVHTIWYSPNCQFLDMFAREKGMLDLKDKEVDIDVFGAENRRGDSLKRNPSGQVPYFELDDGTVLAETIAMMEYMEDLKPEPVLIGSTAQERAHSRMWQRRMEEHFVYPLFTAFRFWTASDDADPAFKDFFKGKAPILIPGEWRTFKEWALFKLKWLEELKQVDPTDFIAGDKVTIVDLQVYSSITWFAGPPGFGDIVEENKAALPWCVAFMARVKARDAIKAAEAYAASKS